MIENNKKGFTLIELMIVIAILGGALAVSYKILNSQRLASKAQDEIVDVQQSVRAALYFMEKDIRLAGHPGYPDNVTGSGVRFAGPAMIRLTMDIHDGADNDGDGEIDEWDEVGEVYDSDLDGQLLNTEDHDHTDGDITDRNEDITYGFEPAFDADGDGVVDAGATPPLGTDPGAAPFGRRDNNTAGGFVDLVESIHAVAFAYAFDADNNGRIDFVDTNGDGDQDVGEPIIWAVDVDGDGWLDTTLDTNADGAIDVNDTPGGAALGTTVDIEDIRIVRIWLLARTKHMVPSHTENRTFVVGDKHITPNDNFRRRLLTTMVKCRNLGG